MFDIFALSSITPSAPRALPMDLEGEESFKSYLETAETEKETLSSAIDAPIIPSFDLLRPSLITSVEPNATERSLSENIMINSHFSNEKMTTLISTAPSFKESENLSIPVPTLTENKIVDRGQEKHKETDDRLLTAELSLDFDPYAQDASLLLNLVSTDKESSLTPEMQDLLASMSRMSSSRSRGLSALQDNEDSTADSVSSLSPKTLTDSAISHLRHPQPFKPAPAPEALKADGEGDIEKQDPQTQNFPSSTKFSLTREDEDSISLSVAKDLDAPKQMDKIAPTVTDTLAGITPAMSSHLEAKTIASTSVSTPPAQQLDVQIRHGLEKGLRTLAFDFTPGDLGRVQVELDISTQGMVSARIQTDSKETFDLLNQDAATREIILQAFKDAGLQADENALQFSYQDSSAHHAFTEQALQQHQIFEDMDSKDADPSSTPYHARTDNTRMIDILA